LGEVQNLGVCLAAEIGFGADLVHFQPGMTGRTFGRDHVCAAGRRPADLAQGRRPANLDRTTGVFAMSKFRSSNAGALFRPHQAGHLDQAGHDRHQ
jgi:hypothetical protein